MRISTMDEIRLAVNGASQLVASAVESMYDLEEEEDN
jgi:hypothetical protein